MPRTYDSKIGATSTYAFSGAGSNYLIETAAGVLYHVFIDGNSPYVVFRKSTDRGLTWSTTTTIFYVGSSNQVVQLSVWYDRWSNISAGLIHCAYVDLSTDDVYYRTIDTESSDALSTQTTIFAGTSTALGQHISITRAVGGNVYCKVCIDAGAEGGFYRLPNANVPNGAWDAARTVDEALATQDKMILLPNLTAADNQDIMAIFHDNDANEISRKLYDDSANSWGETSIATSMTHPNASASFPHFACAVDLANSQILLVAWSAVDTANADLRCWYITDSAITEVTNVVQNSTDDQGFCGIAIDKNTGYWWVYYGGKSDGSETFPSAINVYCKYSTDSGTTWSAEIQVSQSALNLTWLICAPWEYTTRGAVVRHSDTPQGYSVYVGAPLVQPRATHQVYGG